MAKKSYKRTMDENKIHEKAVKMRKKTDEQLKPEVKDLTKARQWQRIRQRNLLYCSNRTGFQASEQ